MKININFLSHLADFLLEYKMFQTNLIEEIKPTLYVQYQFTKILLL